VVLKDAYRCLGLKDDGTGRRFMTLFPLPARYAYFSDTILLWVPLEQLCVAPFILRCLDLAREALNKGIPLHGASAIGKAVMHKASSTFIGQPLVEAARLEAALQWVGVALRLRRWLGAISR
jgi:hypothetical protein